MSAPIAARAPGRNDPCPCGSGLKYKACCAAKDQRVAQVDGEAQALFRQAMALERQGRTPDALAAYERASRLPPVAADALSRIGHLMLVLGRPAEAVQALRAAAAAAPDRPERRMDLVRALNIEKNDVAAEAEVRAVLAAEPGMADAWWVLGRILSESGRFDEARAALQRCAEIDPDHGLVLYDLVRCYRLTEADRPLVETLRQQLKAGGPNDRRVRLNLALAKALDDLGDYEGAMRALAEAAQARSAMARYDAARFERATDATIARFTPQFLAQHAPDGDPSPRPMFVLGLPRSGTTLVEQILSSHPDVAAGGELPYWTTRAAQFAALAPDAAVAPFLRQTAQEALRMIDTLAPGAARMIDKTPHNLRWAGLIHAVFPNATIIHCRRDPRDVGLSMAMTYFSPAAELGTFGDDFAHYWRQCARLAAHWRAVLPPERFIEVEYEALVREPEAQTRRLVAACGLPWDEACLHPERNARVVRTPSKWQARQPIAAGSLGRWRRYEPWLGRLADLAAANST